MSSLPHLVFPPPAPTTKPRGGGGSGKPVRLPDHERQSERLTPRFQTLQDAFTGEAAEMHDSPSGVAPEQVVVFEVVGSVDSFLTALRHTDGMEFLVEWTEEDIPPDADFYLDKDGRESEPLDGRLYLVLSNQQAIDELVSLWNRFTSDSETTFDRGLTGWKHLFPRLRDVRRWSSQDRLAETCVLESWQEALEYGDDIVRFEAELWFRQSPEQRTEAYDRFLQAVTNAGGQCIHQSVIEGIGWHGVLGEVPTRAVSGLLADQTEIDLVKVNEVMFFRPTGQAVHPIPSEVEIVANSRDGQVPTTGQPVVALLDGLPIENHQLLAGRIVVDDPDEWASTYAASDRHHGTAMASLILHGELDADEQTVTRPIYVRPLLRPDPDDFRRPRHERMPEDRLYLDRFHQAVRRIAEGEGETPAAAPTVRIINVSLGDWTRPFNRYVSPWARLIDWLSEKYNLLFVVSAGNQTDDLLLNPSPFPQTPLIEPDNNDKTIAAVLRGDRHRKIISPAESINAVTVGALHCDQAPNGQTGRLVDLLEGESELMPSPASRIGPGLRGAIKPELHVSGGRQLYMEALASDPPFEAFEIPPVHTLPPGQRAASPGRVAGDTNATNYSRGTSNATALMSRAACRVHDALLELRQQPGGDQITDEYLAVLTKALLAHSASWGPSSAIWERIFRDNANKQLQSVPVQRYLTRFFGSGSPDVERSIVSAKHRTTVLGCGAITDGSGQVFSLPLPPSLAARTDWRRLTVTLAWLSPINARNQRYRCAKLWVRPPKDVLRLNRLDAQWQDVEKGTLQHVVMEGEEAAVYRDGDTLALQVNCTSDAGTFESPVRFGLAVTLETYEDIQIDVPIYDEIEERLRVPIQA